MNRESLVTRQRWYVYSQKEVHLYGGSRLGIDETERPLMRVQVSEVWNPFNGTWCDPVAVQGQVRQVWVNGAWVEENTPFPAPTYERFTDSTGKKRYELSNHLGNVLAVVSDRKLPQYQGDMVRIAFYEADQLSLKLYDPFGTIAQEWRITGTYRFTFNGKEDESWGVQDYGFRHYDPLIARFISVDPLKHSFAWFTPYQYAGNSPIMFVDLDGTEPEDPLKLSIWLGQPIQRPTNALMNSGYGYRDIPPFGPHHHNGYDFSASHGSSVTSTLPGRVSYIHSDLSSSGGWGKMVVIDHGVITYGDNAGKRLFTAYAHLSKISVSMNQIVSGGHPVGEVGGTGMITNSYGPHLHFTSLVNSTSPVNTNLTLRSDFAPGIPRNNWLEASRFGFYLQDYNSLFSILDQVYKRTDAYQCYEDKVRLHFSPSIKGVCLDPIPTMQVSFGTNSNNVVQESITNLMNHVSTAGSKSYEGGMAKYIKAVENNSSSSKRQKLEQKAINDGTYVKPSDRWQYK